MFAANRATLSKPNLKFEMNPEQPFRFAADQAPVKEFNLNTTYSDKAYVRQPLSFETYRDVGAVYSVSFPLRVQLNSEFYSVAIAVEEPDEDYLKRQGIDNEGALYKMYNKAELGYRRR